VFAVERLTPREQGDIGELSAMSWLASKGASVFVPLGHSPDVDVIASFGDQLSRIQVKTSNQESRGRYAVAICTRGGNQSWNGRTKYFDPNRFDFLFILVGNGRRWLIPFTAVESRTAITVGGPKYSEFEIERGDGFERRSSTSATPLDLPPPLRGGAGAGEPGRPVKSVATPEWVRFPPPPSSSSSPRTGPREERPRRFVGRFERTRISSGHQVTIPRDAFIPAGFEVGDKLHATCTGPGRVILERIDSRT
jgi:Holliday junction resolvase-like predicted endonuclease